MTVDWILENNNEERLTLKIRPLIIDTRIKEYVTGTPHEITDRLFAVRRVFRVNDSLPEDSTPKWQWQRGGWLLVDRLSGRISPINLPDFDPLYSGRKLVPRLRCLLRSLRRWQENLRDGRAAEPPQAGFEEGSQQHNRGRRCPRFRVLSA